MSQDTFYMYISMWENKSDFFKIIVSISTRGTELPPLF
jgi:hypothetical protein